MSHSETDRPDLRRSSWAERFAAVALDNVTRAYPYAAHHATTGPEDRALPVELHPAFATSYDWHSSVHMHWLAARLLAHGLPAGLEERLTAVLQAHLGAANLAIEADYLRSSPHFERPYGWAWLMRLAAEVSASEVPALRELAPGFVPVVDAVADLVTDWTAAAAHPVRHGVHSNSAFGLLLVHDAARVLGRPELVGTVERAARSWFGADRGWPFDWERSGHDFLSAGLSEADLMAAVLPPEEYGAWARGFLSGVDAGAEVLRPTVVRDPSDAQQVHLYGLDLSRAGSTVRIAAALRVDGEEAAVAGLLRGAADDLLASGLAASVGEEYYSTHWLATFAWDAMEAREGAAR
ncbi:DUF2891 domain-containing protein [Curtobacterium sp. MCSS17_008]|uniref:DUF2891 family protein n=1 Tax=Curtobacterium sp. MCSS17_008 TaxID=2175647 RepID=UPI000DAA9B4B|nr:DUF2891 family protein [Curtobacterium sp. MCSS17_008]PZF58186.1 DUF2891 domain-containing protein [Curtobacterium sp. MCSS17_008]